MKLFLYCIVSLLIVLLSVDAITIVVQEVRGKVVTCAKLFENFSVVAKTF